MAISDAVAVLAFTVAVYLVVRPWTDLPQRIPVHFNVRGEPDGWGGKGSLLIGPAISFATVLLLAIVGRFPRSFNFPHPITEANAQRQYTLAREMMAMMRGLLSLLALSITIVQVQAARDGVTARNSMVLVVVLGIVAPLVVLVVYFIRAGSARNG